jgi:hypothetical protein
MLDRNLAEAIVSVAEDSASRVKQIKKYAEAAQMLLDAGVNVRITKYALMYRNTFEIQRNQLPLIRKLFGRLRAGYRSLGVVRDGVQMIDVRVHLHDKQWDGITFEYEVPYRSGGKCHIETVDSSYKTLVCKA